MRHVFLSFLLVLCCAIPGFAQSYIKDATIVAALNTQVLRYKKAVLEDDSEAALNLTHPDMVRMMGGADKMRASAKKGKELRDSYKVKFVAMDYVVPDSILVTEASYQSAFTFDLVTKFEDGTTAPDKMLMVAYGDIPQNKWYFITIPFKDVDKLRPAFKFIDPELFFPE